MRQLRSLMTLAMIGVTTLVMCGSSSADVIMSTTTTRPTFNSSELAVSLMNGEIGTTVFGTILNPSATVSFSTSTDILDNGAVNGTPAVRAEDNSINDVVITVPGFEFTDAIFDVYGVYAIHPGITVTVTLNDKIVTETFNLTAGQTSRNWFTIQAINNETISSIDISGAKFYALEDTHISGPANSAVPEPSSIALFFSGLLGVGQQLRRRNRKSEKVQL